MRKKPPKGKPRGAAFDPERARRAALARWGKSDPGTPPKSPVEPSVSPTLPPAGAPGDREAQLRALGVDLDEIRAEIGRVNGLPREARMAGLTEPGEWWGSDLRLRLERDPTSGRMAPAGYAPEDPPRPNYSLTLGAQDVEPAPPAPEQGDLFPDPAPRARRRLPTCTMCGAEVAEDQDAMKAHYRRAHGDPASWPPGSARWRRS